MWNLFDNLVCYSALGTWMGAIATMIGLVS